jgi:hypothetical protein
LTAPWASSREVHLGTLLRIAESSLAVTHLAEPALKRASPDWTARRTRGGMEENGFDAAPIDEPEIRRLVVKDALRPDDEPVVCQAGTADGCCNAGLLGPEPGGRSIPSCSLAVLLRTAARPGQRNCHSRRFPASRSQHGHLRA